MVDNCSALSGTCPTIIPLTRYLKNASPSTTNYRTREELMKRDLSISCFSFTVSPRETSRKNTINTVQHINNLSKDSVLLANGSLLIRGEREFEVRKIVMRIRIASERPRILSISILRKRVIDYKLCTTGVNEA